MRIGHWRRQQRWAVALAGAVLAVALSLGADAIGQVAPGASPSTTRSSQVPSTLAQIREGIPGFEQLDELERTNRVRDWVYVHTDVALDRSMLLDPSGAQTASQDLDTNFGAMARHEGGHWCAGVARLLMQAYQGLGYRSWVLSVGDVSALTHAVTLVEVRGRIYVEDAYFNHSFVDEQDRLLPLFELLERLRDKRPARVREGPSRFRTVHYGDSAQKFEKSWVLRRADRATVRQLGENRFVCQSQTSYQSFAEACEELGFRVPGAYAFLERRGLPRDLQFLMLFPFAILDEKEGYVTAPERNDILRRILDIQATLPLPATGPSAATGPTTAASAR